MLKCIIHFLDCFASSQWRRHVSSLRGTKQSR